MFFFRLVIDMFFLVAGIAFIAREDFSLGWILILLGIVRLLSSVCSRQMKGKSTAARNTFRSTDKQPRLVDYSGPSEYDSGNYEDSGGGFDGGGD